MAAAGAGEEDAWGAEGEDAASAAGAFVCCQVDAAERALVASVDKGWSQDAPAAAAQQVYSPRAACFSCLLS